MGNPNHHIYDYLENVQIWENSYSISNNVIDALEICTYSFGPMQFLVPGFITIHEKFRLGPMKFRCVSGATLSKVGFACAKANHHQQSGIAATAKTRMKNGKSFHSDFPGRLIFSPKTREALTLSVHLTHLRKTFNSISIFSHCVCVTCFVWVAYASGWSVTRRKRKEKKLVLQFLSRYCNRHRATTNRAMTSKLE